MQLTTKQAAACFGVLFLGACAARPAVAQTGEASDRSVSRQSSAVGFTIYAKKIFTVKQEGRFKDFSGNVEYSPSDPGSTRVDLTVYTGSVDTKDAERDGLLRSSDFFDVERFPTMHFTSTAASVQPDGRLLITGDLTIRGIKKRLDVPVRIRPANSGSAAAAPTFETTFEIDRTEFGLNGTPKFAGFNISIAKNVQIHLAIAVATVVPRF